METLVTPSSQPTGPRSDFLRTLSERGFLHQCTDLEALDSWLCSGAGTAYSGFDLTADSLHVGHLIPITMLRWFQKTGNKPIALLGGATSRLGDPSFRDTSRPFLSQEEIMKNLIGIRKVFERFLAFGDGPTDAVMVNNADWLGGLNYLDFLRDIGPHFSVNRMLTAESVRQRLERDQSLSLLEFNYMVMQAYDFHILAESRGCLLQLGGSDQWGNIVSGVEFGRRIGGRALFGLTAPLLTTSSGAKMGKSVSGAVWLNADRLSPYEFWQFWRNAADVDVGRFLRLFTELPLSEIARLEVLRDSEINEGKKILADQITSLCHGADAAAQASETSRRTFEAGEVPTGLPTINLPDSLRGDFPLVDAMVVAGLARSKSEARRLIVGGGVRVNGGSVKDETTRLGDSDVQDGVIRLSVGRKRHILLQPA
ncbi:tyrosine--tRNA ligase [Rhizobium leguminosarum]|uniref:tyrosine--tRNA ligase n=1 Tax=Rhizobium leguminosarum TaxID=384 RepID=UPI001E0D3A82|nr:tyrosine--tRNA ligase [Rhizobium leguminosarum]MBY5453158.1 tyrosine--tRNA ligase [Rhizobium leguminosarum]